MFLTPAAPPYLAPTHGGKRHLAQRRVHVKEVRLREVVASKLSKVHLVKPNEREAKSPIPEGICYASC